MSDEAYKNFKNASNYLETASKYGPYKENGKLWFYKGIANYNLFKHNNSKSSEYKDKYFEDFKKAAIYDYYDIKIFEELLLNIDAGNKNGSKRVPLLYYLKRYPNIISEYSDNNSYKNCWSNLIEECGYEGAYYCALSHYEFKDFKRSFEILNKLISLSEVIKNCESFKSIITSNNTGSLSENEKNQLNVKIIELINSINGKKPDYISKFKEIKIYCEKLISNLSNNQSSNDVLLNTINDIKELCETAKLIPNFWYYNGLILRECINNFKDFKRLKLNEFDIFVEKKDNGNLEAQFEEFVNHFDGKNLKGYISWNLDKKIEFVKYLIYPSNNKHKSEDILQKIFDDIPQIAFEKALEDYNKIIESFQIFSLYYDKALVLDELKRYKEAIESLDEFIKNKPRDAKAWLKKGTILFKLTKIEAAKNALEKSIGYFKILIDENPGNPDHWYNRGTAHSSLAEVLTKMKDYQGSFNEYEEAVKAFDNATILNPDFALAWNNKGNAYLKLKKYNKAIEAFKKAFEVNPNYYLALHNKGDALYSLGKYDEAIKAYEQVIKQGNDNFINTISYKSYNNKGLAYYKLEKYDEAIKAFDEAIKIHPTFADALINRGLVFYKLEMFSEAKKAFEEALELETGDKRASNNLAVVLATEGKLDQARDIFENILEESPDFTLASANLAELFLNSGGIEKASEKIKNIPKNDKNPDTSMGYVHFLDGRIKIEDIESKEKKYSEAAKSFEKAASFSVEDPTSLLWVVYAKYLCQKFEVNQKADSSEKQNSEKENISPKNEDICSNEFSNSILSDLGKVLVFCNAPVVKKNSLTKLLDQKLLWEIIVAIIFLNGLYYLFKAFEPNIQNFSTIQMMNNLKLISIGLVILFIIFKQRLLWPVTVAIISLLGFYQLNSHIIEFLLFTATIIIILLKLLNQKLALAVAIVAAFAMLFGPLHFYIDQMMKYLSVPNMLILLLLLLIFTYGLLPLTLVYELMLDLINFIKLKNSVDRTGIILTKVKIKIKMYLIKFNKYKEIKAYTLYLLGYFYFKLQDYTAAKEKLQECINLRPEKRIDKAARELLDNIWKHKIKPPFWTYWFNSPVNTWRRRAVGTFAILGILLILFVHTENPQPVAWKETSPNSQWNFIPNQINIYPYIISYYPVNNTTSNFTGFPNNGNNANNEDNNNNNNDNDNTTWNILTPSRVNIYPDIPDNFFDITSLLILFLILISPSVRIAETIKIVLKKGVGDVTLDLGPIAAPPEFNFELSPSLMQDVIRRLDENL